MVLHRSLAWHRVRRRVPKIFVIQLRRGGLLDRLHGLLNTLGTQCGNNLVMHFVERQRIFFANFINEETVRH